MTKVIEAFRETPMNDRLQARVDKLIEQFHGRFQTRFGAVVNPDYLRAHDGSEIEILILVDDDKATRAASEFRACGFIVGEPYDARQRDENAD